MATNYASLTQQLDWAIAETNTGEAYFSRVSQQGNAFYGLSAPNAYTFSDALWGNQLIDTTDVQQRLLIQPPVDGCQLAMLKFFGIADTAGEHALAAGAIWGVSELTKASDTEYVAEYLGRFDITIGTASAAASGIIPDPEAVDPTFACRATVQVDRASFPGLRIAGHATSVPSQAGPVLLVDCFGYARLLVELRCVQPAYSLGDIAQKVGFLYRFA